MAIGFLHLHRTFAYLVLLFVFVVMLKSLHAFLNKKPHTERDRKLGLFALIAVHVQFVVGIALWFVMGYHSMLSQIGTVMKDPILRFKVIEHPFVMILGVVFITIGYSQSKRSKDLLKKHQLKGFFFLIGLACILSRIPWDRLI